MARVVITQATTVSGQAYQKGDVIEASAALVTTLGSNARAATPAAGSRTRRAMTRSSRSPCRTGDHEQDAKAVTEAIPPDYASLPDAERKKIVLRLARQVRARLGLGGGTVSAQLGRPEG